MTSTRQNPLKKNTKRITIPALDKATLTPPCPPVKVHTYTRHGIEIHDDYAWMKADNWKDVLRNPRKLPAAIRAHLKAENAFTKQALAPLKGLSRTLTKEMRGRIKENDSSVPNRDGDYLYYTRYNEGGEYPLICRAPVDHENVEQIMLDGDIFAEPHDYFDIGDATHSSDHRLLAWSFDDQGSEYYTIHVRDLNTGKDLSDHITGTDGDVVWTADASAFYYVVLDDNHRPYALRRHLLGTPVSTDVTVLESQDPGHFMDLDESLSGAFAVISITDHETAEVYLLDRHVANAKPRLIAARRPHIRYDVEPHNDTLYILTNTDGADDGKIVIAPLNASQAENWRELIPARDGVMIIQHLVFEHFLVRLERENALPRIVVRELATGEEHTLTFDEEAYALGIEAGFEFDTDTVRFVYASMTTPAEAYDYNMRTRNRTLRKRQEVPSGHVASDYVTKRIYAASHDGAQVPVSILYHRDTPLDGTAPCLLYGYGSYGSSMSASFRTNPLSLVNRGFIYVIAHIRGGTEKGWNWYQDGKLGKKQNTFKDFIAVAHALIAQKYTSKGHIVAHGGSAGGMLMGAVVNMAPELFAGIIADVPFVDCLNTILDAELPLTPPEWPEWGNPIEDKKAFETIRNYSPYDNVKAQQYPAIFALGGLSDPRVTYWEPAKWVAKLRATMTGGGPVMLHTNMSAGHGGASGRFESLKETAQIYAFALSVVNGERVV
jgi:oligopeptidase B